MPRAPFQVLVIPFTKIDGKTKYCVFQRADPPGQHQFIAGGGEDDETPLEAARRESFEEAGIGAGEYVPLTSLCYIPTNIFSEKQRQAWGGDTFVIPEHVFAVELPTAEIVLSHEHLGYQWLGYRDALESLHWQSNKTALYELDCRLRLEKKE